ncbi:MAG: anti-sigma factor antagonist [Chloroflexi bacterium HGW-Chloroflexi-6]|nr:MAG: anti-sigma factor antagonist [Chloroflexi bacterium HGW-Chloroflexi-6]
MEIQDRQVNGISVVQFFGSIDALTAPAVTEHLSGLITAGQTRLVVDLSGVDFTSSAGLRLLLVAVKETRSLGGDLRLAAVQPDVLKVLKISGFTNILKLFEDVDGAVASYG